MIHDNNLSLIKVELQRTQLIWKKLTWRKVQKIFSKMQII